MTLRFQKNQITLDCFCLYQYIHIHSDMMLFSQPEFSSLPTNLMTTCFNCSRPYFSHQLLPTSGFCRRIVRGRSCRGFCSLFCARATVGSRVYLTYIPTTAREELVWCGVQKWLCAWCGYEVVYCVEVVQKQCDVVVVQCSMQR